MVLNNEKITVIVPIYNVENYLARCIDSIINQTYRNLEILLVNDGSTDNCLSICSQYSQKDNRITIIDKKNGGLGSARNAGIDAMKGAYVIFIDSDDYIADNMIEYLYDLLLDKDADISACNFSVFDDHKIYLKKNNEKIRDFTRDKAIQNMFYPNGIKWAAWNKLYKASLFKNIRYQEGVYSEDMATTYKIFYLSNKIVYSNRPLYFYYHRNDGIMRSKPAKRYYDEIHIIKDMIAFFEDNLKHLLFYPKAFCGKIALNNYIGLKKTGGYEKEEEECFLSIKKYWKLSFRAKFVKFKYKLVILAFVFLDSISFGHFKKSRLFDSFCKKTKSLK